MTKNSKPNNQAQYFGGQQNARSTLASIQKQFANLQAEQRRFKGECLGLAKKALASRNDSGWEDLTKLIELLENL